MSGKHWTAVVNQAVVQRAKNGSFNLCIEGGSEYGQFVVIGDVLTDRVLFRSGNLSPGEIILEINSKHIGGYTQTDGISLIKDSSDSLYITSVHPGLGISRDLRKYLGTRFPRGSVDHELQQTIRDNLYMRTVPCTTRKPRNGEVPGVDYEFLTVNQYLELERSGKLLESGFYESNYYGTPKPPKTPMTPGTGTIRRPKLKNQKSDATLKKEDGGLGPLPKDWEKAFTKDGEVYYVDHTSGRTQWDDPRKIKSLSQPRLAIQQQEEQEEDLPSGWEKVDDSKYGTYYIDHVNRRTQYERPEPLTKRKNSHSSRIFNRKEPEPRNYESEKKLTIDASKLQGDTFRVSLRKGAKGFGFTIVGGEQPGEVLQVNNIVRGGTADVDGRLRTGDIIMRLNSRNVLSWSHSDIIRFLQQTRVGEIVELDVVRGYPLPFDPADPGVKKVGYQLVNGQDNMRRSVSDASLVSENNNRANGGGGNFQRQPYPSKQPGLRGSKSSGYLSEGEATYNRRNNENNRLGATTPVSFRSGPPAYAVVPVVRGPNGFGFTIADSPYGQRVKEIIDRQRCEGLLQGDVLIRINDNVVHNLDHTEVVEVLKSCRRGEATNFQVQRSGVLTVVKSMPVPAAIKRIARPKSMPAFDDEPPAAAPSVRSSTSLGIIATNGETSTANTTTYETRNHPQVSEAADGYKSLKRAVQSNSRDVDSSRDSGLGFVDHVITLKRGAGGFGFRIIGGQEESTQVSVDTIVPNGAAQVDGRLRHHDIILAVDGINVVDASHKRVISLMGNAGLNGQVTLRIRRKTEKAPSEDSLATANSKINATSSSAFKVINDQRDDGSSYSRDRRKSPDNESIHSDKHVAEWIEDQRRPRDFQPYKENAQPYKENGLRSKSESNLINRPKSCPPPVKPKPLATSLPSGVDGKEIILNRNVNEGFGFVIMSLPSSNGSVIGRIIPGSPSDRCGELAVNDKLVEVNGHSVSDMTHSEIVSMVKNSGLQVKLLIENIAPIDEDEAAPPPPRPVEPRNYTPTSMATGMSSFNSRQSDTLRDEYMRQKQQQEEQRMNDIRDREHQQPSRPKSAPINAQNQINNMQRVTVSAADQGSYRGGTSMTREDRQHIQESAKLKMSDGEPTEIVLQKGERGFGFSIRGGEGMPLFVLRIAQDGPAFNDGRIKVGDEILEINGNNAKVMSHAEAVNTIRNCNQTATLLIRRPKPQNHTEERIPNGHAQQYDRPKSGYY